ncbi:MAG: methylmalonyl-CoA mutase family protein [bacterium]|nr:methylmalonyl-CoA mutase family protein [bacterium]
MRELRQVYERWHKEVYEKSRAKSPERQQFKSTSGFEIPELAGPWDDSTGEDTRATEFPGEYPFTRGIQPTMYRGRLWTMRQYAGFGSAAETNKRYRFLLDSGQTGLSVAFDLPTQMGYDSSDAMAEGEVGKVGVAIDTLDDMRALFNGIPLSEVTTSMTINAPATILLMMYQLVAEEQGARPEQLGGTIQNDILKEYMARGTYIFPPAPSMRLTVDSFRYCTTHLPQWNFISVSGYHIREAGCSAAQEIAFTLAGGIEYTRQAIEAGLSVDEFAGRLSFFFNAHNNLFEEVAKFRAARRLWARIMRQRFAAQNPRSWMLRFHTQTAGSMLTAQQPLNNVARTTLQALSAVLGGTQSLHTNGYDEALALPTEQSAEIALRTQQILAYESGVADTVDPLGGSWFVERLTNELEEVAVAYIERIDGMGGMLAAVERGYPQSEIQQQAYEWQRSVETNERVIVGVNKYESAAEVPLDLQRNYAGESEQKQRLSEYIERRGTSGTWTAECEKLNALAQSDARFGYCEQILACLSAGATGGEIVKALELVWGRHRPRF